MFLWKCLQIMFPFSQTWELIFQQNLKKNYLVSVNNIYFFPFRYMKYIEVISYIFQYILRTFQQHCKLSTFFNSKYFAIWPFQTFPIFISFVSKEYLSQIPKISIYCLITLKLWHFFFHIFTTNKDLFVLD